MLPKFLSLYKAQTVTARQIIIVETDPSFSWSSDDNKLSTFTFQYTQVMMKITSQSQLFKGFSTIFWASWIAKCFSYLCLVFVAMFIMPSNFWTQLATIKARMSFVVHPSVVLILFWAGNNNCKNMKVRQWETRTKIRYDLGWDSQYNTVYYKYLHPLTAHSKVRLHILSNSSLLIIQVIIQYWVLVENWYSRRFPKLRSHKAFLISACLLISLVSNYT